MRPILSHLSILRLSILCGLSLITSIAQGLEVIYPVQDRTISRNNDGLVTLFSANDAWLFSGTGKIEGVELKALLNFAIYPNRKSILGANKINLQITRHSENGTVGMYKLVHITPPVDSIEITKSAYELPGKTVLHFNGESMGNNKTVNIDVTDCIKYDIKKGYKNTLFRIESETSAGTSNNIRLYSGQGSSIPSDNSYRVQLQLD